MITIATDTLGQQRNELAPNNLPPPPSLPCAANRSQPIAARLPSSRPPLRSWATPGTFKQRVFVCGEDYKPGGPIFFYAGNEADVLL